MPAKKSRLTTKTPRAPEMPTEPAALAAKLDRVRIDQALAEMARAIASSAGLPEAQRTQLTILTALTQAKTCWLLDYLPTRERLQIAQVRGRNDERIAAVAPGEGPVGRAFSERRVMREDGLLAIPLPGNEEPIGCLVLLEPKLELSDSLAHAFAAQIAAAYDVARLKDDAARRSKDLQTAIAGLKSLEKNREELLSNVSHDLKNPLTTVRAYLAMFSSGKLGELNDKQLRAVQTCERNADRLLRMVQDLLLLSRLQSGQMSLNQRPFGLKGLVTEVIQSLTPLAEQSKAKLVLAKASAEVFVRGDRERMAEALFNLIEHGLHQVEIDGVVEIAVTSDGSLAEVRVTDEGVGMTTEQVEHLFDPFHRSEIGQDDRQRGASLGLPIVAKIVQLHGGRVEAHSKLGGGTQVRVFLPAFAAAVSDAGDKPAPRVGDILLVEDDRDCREVLQELLEQEGYTVASSDTVEQALKLLGECRPAMVLLDLRLAQEDGRSVLRHIRSTSGMENTAVYIISGASEVASLSTGTGVDRIDGFFEKPLQLGKLLGTVASVVRPGHRA
jgi:signal transduction histidine kinase/CheY-like chemotaxis protein